MVRTIVRPSPMSMVMRGAGRSERYVHHTRLTLLALERFAGKTVEQITPIDVSRYLGRPGLSPRSRESYFSCIACFYKWWAKHGGVNVTADLTTAVYVASSEAGRGAATTAPGP